MIGRTRAAVVSIALMIGRTRAAVVRMTPMIGRTCVALIGMTLMIGRACAVLIGMTLALSTLLAGCGGSRGTGDPGAWTNTQIGEDLAAWSDAHQALRTRVAEAPGEPYWPHRIAELELGRPGPVPGSETGSGVIRTEEAERWLRQALTVDPGYAPSLTLLSSVLYDEGRHYEAIDILQPIVSAEGDRVTPEVRACLALHQVAAGDPAGAEGTLAPLEPRGEHWASVGSVLTYTRLHGEQYREAPRWAERALEADESAQNCNNYGIALLQEGRPKEARDVLLRALELEPDLPGALYNLAIVERFYFFDDEAALGWYRRYATHSSHDPDKLAEIFGQSPSAPLSVTGGSQ